MIKGLAFSPTTTRSFDHSGSEFKTKIEEVLNSGVLQSERGPNSGWAAAEGNLRIRPNPVSGQTWPKSGGIFRPAMPPHRLKRSCVGIRQRFMPLAWVRDQPKITTGAPFHVRELDFVVAETPNPQAFGTPVKPSFTHLRTVLRARPVCFDI